MSIFSYPIVPYLNWLHRQYLPANQKLDQMFEKISNVNLNDQDETTMRAIGDSCIRLGANFETLYELGCSPATAAEWVQGICPMGPNQQFEYVDAMVQAAAMTNGRDMPTLKWRWVAPKRTYDHAVNNQLEAKQPATVTPIRPTIRWSDRTDDYQC